MQASALLVDQLKNSFFIAFLTIIIDDVDSILL